MADSQTTGTSTRVGNYDPADDVPLPGGGDVRDPYPHFVETRKNCPVLHVGTDQHHMNRDTWMLFRYEDVSRILEEDATFSSIVTGDAMRDVMGRTILEMQGAEHLRHRKLVAMAFRPRAQERWERELVRPLVHELIDEFEPRGRAELVREVLYRYPIQVIARILGLPREDSEQFQRWAVRIIAHDTDKERGLRASRELREYLAPILAARRADPQDDIISELVRAEVDGHVLTDEEILPFLLLLMPAGGETTYRATGNLLFGLLSHPDQLDAVRADRSLIPAAVEEALRWEPPLLMLARTPVCPVEMRGQSLKPGSLIAIGLGSANHDEDFIDEPERFDITRGTTRHVTFGNGPHMCLGMHLAKMEMRVALDVLLDRLPGLRFDADAMAAEDPPHIHGMTFRSPTAIPIVWDHAN